MDFRALPERLAHVREGVARHQTAGGWTHPVTLVAVTKGFGLVHSVDSAALAAELARRAGERGVKQRVLLQVNVAREPQKSGCTPEEAPALARAVAGLPPLA